MGVSVEGTWIDAKNRSSRYLKLVSLDDDSVYHDFWLKNAKRESLSMMIHEINECEVNDILLQWDIVNVLIMPVKKESVKMLSYDGGVRVSHIISPYGLNGCILSRDKTRARW